VGAGIDVAVQATLIAAITDVDLQRVEAPSAQRGKVGLDQQGEGRVHEELWVLIV
jgi:hypothetical protein